MTQQVSFRFKVPALHRFRETTSFGIEPCKVNAKGVVVKAGKAVVRIVMWRTYELCAADAADIASTICEHLNMGLAYTGPKVIHVDGASRIKHFRKKLHEVFDAT